MDDDSSTGSASMVPCPCCGRSFAADRVEKHVKVCAAAAKKTRKVFDSRHARLGEYEEEMRSVARNRPRPSAPPPARSAPGGGGEGKLPKWKAQSSALRQAMEYNRKMAEAKKNGIALSSLPPPPATSAEADDRIECPHCQRKFNAKAAERHIPKCSEIRAKPSTLRRGAGGGAAKGRR